MLVLVGGLVGGLFGREGGGCRGVGGGGGLWGVLGASGGGRKGQGSDVVMEFVYSAPTASSTSARPRKATGSKAQADSCGFTSTREAPYSDSCHSQIRPDETWVPKSPRSAIPDVSFSHHVTQPPLRFSRGTTSSNARRPTRRGSALDRSALSDFKATQQEILASINLEAKRRAISTRPNPISVRAKWGVLPVMFLTIADVQRAKRRVRVAFIPGI